MLTSALMATGGRKATRRRNTHLALAGGSLERRLTTHARRLMLMIAVGLAAAGCAVAPSGRVAGPPRVDALDLAALHNPASPEFRGTCLGCHTDIMKQATLRSGIKEAHAAMVPFMPDYDAKAGVTDDNCRSCHVKVDPVQHSGVGIRKNSDPSSCAACHGKGGVATRKFYAE